MNLCKSSLLKEGRHWHYTGKTWTSLRACCEDLKLDFEEVSTYIELHPQGNPIASYIKEHRFLVHGLIFKSLSEVALHYCISEKDLRAYLRRGYGIDLAAYLLGRGLGPDYFEVSKNERKQDPN